MSLLQLISEISQLAQHNCRAAMSRFAESDIAGLVERSTNRGRWRGQMQTTKAATALKSVYGNAVPKRLAAQGTDAFLASYRAHAIEKSRSASSALKHIEHDTAHSQNAEVASKLSKEIASAAPKHAAQLKSAQQLHQKLATHHGNLRDQHAPQVEAKGAASSWERADHPEAVKQATRQAREASARAFSPSGTADDHDIARRKHFIAQGVAMAHGAVDLAQKHAASWPQHQTLARKMRVDVA